MQDSRTRSILVDARIRIAQGSHAAFKRSPYQLVRVRQKLLKDYSQAQGVKDDLEASREADEPETSGSK